ncbi:hypothetical protein ACIPW9_37015 [Streptomyces sp. NPDC090052]|uniref:hypothetical protein n=1 Tax=unclassified Streptomyces TaxID=2593676 RepID=UPI00324DD818
MSAYYYSCGTCGANAPLTATRADSEALRDEHRTTVHGGLAPRGERLVRVHGPGGRTPGVRYVSGRRVLLALGALVVAECVARIYSHLR